MEENGFTKIDYKGKLCYQREGFIIMSDSGIWYPCTDLGTELAIGEIYLKTEDDLIKQFEESTGSQF